MATLIDNEEGRQDETVAEASEASQLESVVAPVEETPAETPTEAVADLPDKYQGKSMSDIVKMHQEAEQLLGRQSGEVGELRKVVDEFVMSQSKQETVDEEEIDYFSDPERAIQSAIEKHPAVREAQQASATMRQTTAQNYLKQKHPDMKEILSDEAFIGWVKDSSFRTKLLSEADRNYDYEAADEIFSLWKDRKSLVGQTAQVEKQSRKATAKSASTGGISGSGETSKKIFRRADIIKLMRNDPNRYEALSEEIMKAYSEGRVK